MYESLRPKENVSGVEFKLFVSLRELMRVCESLRPNESESGQEFKLFEAARESTKVHECSEPINRPPGEVSTEKSWQVKQVVKKLYLGEEEGRGGHSPPFLPLL